MATEQITLEFTEDGVREIARIAAEANETMENIGARRLHTIMERLLDELLFEGAEAPDRNPVIDRAYVERMLSDVVENRDLSRYIL